jgi:hypothetical protein
MRGRAAFGGTAGGAVAPRTTQGRLAPAGLVPELALRALRAIERQLGRLPICEVGRQTVILIRPPDQPALDEAGDQSDSRGAHASDSRASRASPSPPRDPPPRSRERGAGTAVQPPSPFRPRPHSPESVRGLFLYSAWLRSRNLRELPLNQPSGARGSQEGRGLRTSREPGGPSLPNAKPPGSSSDLV